MNIGLAYDLKEEIPLGKSEPEDALEEYDSRETVTSLAAVMEALGHSVVLLGGGQEFLSRILASEVDLVFNIAEGRGNYRSREAQVPAILEMLDIAYSGSDPQTQSICLDKPLTKKLVALAGITTPEWKVVENSQQLRGLAPDDLSFPVIVKPAYEGSSKGIRLTSVVNSPEQVSGVVGKLLECYQQPVMLEEYIAGDEVTVGIVGNSPPVVLGVMRILPRQKDEYFVYSLEVKRDWEKLVEYECPAQFDPGILQQIKDSSLKAFSVLGCRDFARLDFRVSREAKLYFLEINPLAGLNPKSSDLPIMAAKVGWTYQALVSAILQAALARYPNCGLK